VTPLDLGLYRAFSGLSIKNEFSFHRTYVRTRQHNIRCWPWCLPEHRENSFCGVPIVVELEGVDPRLALGLNLVGKFRQATTEPLFQLGETFVASEAEDDILFASSNKVAFAGGRERSCTFEFAPKRKWLYRGRPNTRGSTKDLHTFTMYLLDSFNRCIALKDCPFFRIESAWGQDSKSVSRPFQSPSDVVVAESAEWSVPVSVLEGSNSAQVMRRAWGNARQSPSEVGLRNQCYVSTGMQPFHPTSASNTTPIPPSFSATLQSPKQSLEEEGIISLLDKLPGMK